MIEDKTEYKNFRIAIPPGFEEVFTHFYFAENNTDELIIKTLLPSYQAILIFSFGKKPYLISKENTQIKVDKYLMLGPIKQAFKYALPPDTQILTLNFKDDAFSRFFGNTVVSEHLPKNVENPVNEDCFGILWHELNKLNSTNARVNHLLKFSEPYLMDRNKIAAQLLTSKEKSSNSVIKSVASQNSRTERSMQIQHKRHFGYSAKEYSRYGRFLKAVELIQKLALNTSKVDWFEIINTCGYYDQSQLIHDFKYYINLSPTKYLKFQQDICNPLS